MPAPLLGVSLQPRWPRFRPGRRPARAARGGAGNAERLTAAVPSPGRPLGGTAPTAASVVDDLGHLAEAGLTTCTIWLPVTAEHVEKATDWVGAGIMPQLT
jgi:hypothetical protein